MKILYIIEILSHTCVVGRPVVEILAMTKNGLKTLLIQESDVGHYHTYQSYINSSISFREFIHESMERLREKTAVPVGYF